MSVDNVRSARLDVGVLEHGEPERIQLYNNGSSRSKKYVTMTSEQKDAFAEYGAISNELTASDYYCPSSSSNFHFVLDQALLPHLDYIKRRLARQGLGCVVQTYHMPHAPPLQVLTVQNRLTHGPLALFRQKFTQLLPATGFDLLDQYIPLFYEQLEQLEMALIAIEPDPVTLAEQPVSYTDRVTLCLTDVLADKKQARTCRANAMVTLMNRALGFLRATNDEYDWLKLDFAVDGVQMLCAVTVYRCAKQA